MKSMSESRIFQWCHLIYHFRAFYVRKIRVQTYHFNVAHDRMPWKRIVPFSGHEQWQWTKSLLNGKNKIIFRFRRQNCWLTIVVPILPARIILEFRRSISPHVSRMFLIFLPHRSAQRFSFFRSDELKSWVHQTGEWILARVQWTK